MANGLTFDVRLESRQHDRIMVSVLLDPGGDPVDVEGVSLQILGPSGGSVSARMVLPIAGHLQQAMVSTMELRALDEHIPTGCRVVAVAWRGAQRLEASVPTDPYTELQAHMRALHRVLPDEDTRVARLTAEEHARLAREYPWVDEPRIPRAAGQLQVVDHEPDQAEALDELLGDLGVDEVSAEWVRELMQEDDEAPDQ